MSHLINLIYFTWTLVHTKVIQTALKLLNIISRVGSGVYLSTHLILNKFPYALSLITILWFVHHYYRAKINHTEIMTVCALKTFKTFIKINVLTPTKANSQFNYASLEMCSFMRHGKDLGLHFFPFFLTGHWTPSISIILIILTDVYKHFNYPEKHPNNMLAIAAVHCMIREFRILLTLQKGSWSSPLAGACLLVGICLFFNPWASFYQRTYDLRPN